MRLPTVFEKVVAVCVLASSQCIPAVAAIPDTSQGATPVARALDFSPWAALQWLAGIIGWSGVWFWASLIGAFWLALGCLFRWTHGYWPWWCPLYFLG